MKSNILKAVALVPVLLIGLACSSQRASQTSPAMDDNSYKDSVKQALQQTELQDVTVDEDRDKNTITLGGKVHSENARMQAGQVAQAAAANRTIANEISVQSVAPSRNRKISPLTLTAPLRRTTRLHSPPKVSTQSISASTQKTVCSRSKAG